MSPPQLGVSFILLPGPEPAPSVSALDGQTSTAWQLLECDGHRPVVDEVNDAMRRARYDFVAFLDAGDTLDPAAVERVLTVLRDDERVDVAYTDERFVGADGAAGETFLKPDWSPDRMLGHNYLGRLVALRRALIDEVGGGRKHFGDAWEYDLLLRVTARARRIEHIAELAYARAPASSAHFVASEAARDALGEHLQAVGIAAEAQCTADGTFLRLRPKLTEEPLVSIVIPTGGTARRVRGETLDLASNCVESIINRSTYSRYEIVVVIDDRAGDGTRIRLTQVGGRRLRLIEYSQPFNFAHKVNVGAIHSRGEQLLFLNDDTEVITPDWIESMLAFASAPRVGAVGAILRFADRRYQHAGVVSFWGSPWHPFYGFPEDCTGYHDSLRVPCNYTAVTAACLMTPRSAFDAVGGFSLAFPRNYNDVDFCFKLGHHGYRVVCSPEAELFHYESSSRGRAPVSHDELSGLRQRWGRVLDRDPYYSPYFLNGDFATLVHPRGPAAVVPEAPATAWERPAARATG